ncbi:haloacid dehalogenase superfamily, subfamily IA, variant 3 with third motif having DD or ED/beta-phosphoglucomutase family hydrolase [Bryocella elongata]|uniref:Haloacid dehalogenase superfamily, subfamily IA, variant 3 with third motif having DD or ED/beta-phosphoglucomutase family hydrolase n=1 Tax=Bryocella elongata TaxID=863522 RepID=A0A1H6BWM1_9BACT|nr:HAD family phosphatase [Bryocella elongata]SEG65091.1 haloacid dehalogenase superfamily, subfamily IA, variant 3 with third motif having DD or ED/beta-phosphoglucomutase family hydrolase [Bryocella elongata]
MSDITANVPVAPLPIPAGAFKAYLFDLDGTLADSMPLHYKAWMQAVADFGGTFPEDVFYELGGVTIVKTVEILNERFGSHMPPEETAHHKEQLYYAMLPELKPIASVVAHVHAMHGKIPMGIVSGSPRASIAQTLERIGLGGEFDIIVGAEDYTHGKPDPEPFLTAAKKLNIAPADCLVFEDADAGIASAIAAGMQYVRVPRGSISS